LAEELGETLPVTYRVRTSRGWHWYFADPDNEFGNSPGALVKWKIDVRGGNGAGGYVLAAGSTHWSGHVYEAEDPYAMPAAIPEWIKEQLRSSPTEEGEEHEDVADTDWDDRPRYGRATELRAQYERRIAKVHALAVPADQEPNGGAFRHALYLAALDGWRLVDCGLIDEVTMLHQLRDAVRAVWRAEPDDDDRAIVYEEARDKATVSRWIVVEDEAPGADPYECALAEETRRERIRRQARALLDAEGREPLRVLSAEQFLDSPAPDYLVPKMFYKDGLAVVFGAPGAAKSFLVLDVALSLATGTPWRGGSLGRGKVHYIMAEGQATNMLRTKAWLAYHEVERSELAEWFTVIPSAILLTDAGVVDYLPRVAEDKPDLIVLDTKNLMFAGKESQGDDYGAMLRVLHRIREAAGGASVVLIDHSGLHDDTRARGSNAQKGGIEIEIRVTDEGGYRRAQVTRDKSGTDGTEWLYKLVGVPGVLRPAGVDAPAVCVPLNAEEAAAMTPLSDRFEDWNDDTQPELPDDVVEYRGRGKTAIKLLARFMRYSASGGTGFNQAKAREAVLARMEPGASAETKKDRSFTIDRAWGALVEMGRLTPVRGTNPDGKSLWVAKPGDPS
jgi:hypothetical protein